jgi:hypothetical protein
MSYFNLQKLTMINLLLRLIEAILRWNVISILIFIWGLRLEIKNFIPFKIQNNSKKILNKLVRKITMSKIFWLK